MTFISFFKANQFSEYFLPQKVKQDAVLQKKAKTIPSKKDICLSYVPSFKSNQWALRNLGLAKIIQQ